MLIAASLVLLFTWAAMTLSRGKGPLHFLRQQPFKELILSEGRGHSRGTEGRCLPPRTIWIRGWKADELFLLVIIRYI
ncbi:hypothetical protein CEXT_651171 [Caerostris extrusa]|uniref:Secreted protein n=1 Tax=Caerostris extrusa TaxID=172846 RepID=A0AAV4Y5Z2_CAEEX|nr:hypothetical protein CEXT_651171 [Caerostris extrusa]